MEKYINVNDLDLNNLNFESISWACDWRNDVKRTPGTRTICFKINEGRKDSYYIVSGEVPNNGRPEPSSTIIKSSDHFINGFKVVMLSNGEFAYVSESDNSLLPFRFDLATDFNEFGLAMVAKGHYVTWMNQEFKILSKEGEYMDVLDEETFNRNGFMSVEKFRNEETPLSSVTFAQTGDYKCSYVDKNGEIKLFHSLDEQGNLDLSKGVSSFCDSEPISFNPYGYTLTAPWALLSSGVILNIYELVDICEQNGMLDILNSSKKTRLSKVESDGFMMYHFVDENNQTMEFHSMDRNGKVDLSKSIEDFCIDDGYLDFDENEAGYAIINNRLLLSNGTVIHFYDLMSVCAQNGIIGELNSRFEEELKRRKPANQKTL